MGTRELSLKTNKKLGGRMGRWGGGGGYTVMNQHSIRRNEGNFVV